LLGGGERNLMAQKSEPAMTTCTCDRCGETTRWETPIQRLTDKPLASGWESISCNGEARDLCPRCVTALGCWLGVIPVVLA
jgi:hypothetical protein